MSGGEFWFLYTGLLPNVSRLVETEWKENGQADKRVLKINQVLECRRGVSVSVDRTRVSRGNTGVSGRRVTPFRPHLNKTTVPKETPS